MSALRARCQAWLAAGRADLAFDQLAQLLLHRGGPLLEAEEARRYLVALACDLPAAAFGPQREAWARACRITPPAPRATPGRCEFPAVAGDEGRLVLVHVCAARGAPAEDALPERLASEARRAVQVALDVARRVSGVAAPLEVVFDAHFDGPSCGLAVGLAAASHLLQRPLPDRLLATGALGEDGAVLPVAALADKLALLRAARPAGELLVPVGGAGSEPRAREIPTLAAALALLSPMGEDIAAARADVERAFVLGDWPQAARQARGLLGSAQLEDHERAELLLVVLAGANHRGDHEEAGRRAAELRPLLSVVDRFAQSVAHLAVSALDRFALDEAEELLAVAEPVVAPTRREALHLRGTRALVALLRGDRDGALALRRRNLEGCEAQERPRCLGDLADVLLRCGRLDEAQEALREARERLVVAARAVRYQESTRRYLHLRAARLCRARGEQRGAAAELEGARGEPGPGLLVELEGALLHERQAERLAALAAVRLPHDAPVYRALLLRARWLAGDPASVELLAQTMNLPGIPAEELSWRLPY